MRLRNILAALLLASAASAPAAEVVNRYGTDIISDLALIYAGGTHRPDWTVDEIMPYVVHTYSDGSKGWFFDGFLFLEFSTGTKGLQNGVGGDNMADKTDWEWLLDRQFAQGKALHALDSAITVGIKELGLPPLRHKVVLGMPAPIKAQGTKWGAVGGRQLDFANEDDRFEASKWYISEAVKRYAAENFKNIDLTGFYWVEESLYTNGPIVGRVNDWIYRNGFRSYWIPYFGENDFKYHWKDYGFDIAYMQPNYFFRRDVPLSQLEAACDQSKEYGLGVEMEFETQGKSRLQHDDPDSYFTRLEDYIDVFEKKGVYDESAVAWYSGTKGYLDLARSSDAKNHEIADRMARIVAKRAAKKAASLSYTQNQVRDLALIWQGAERRIDWTPDQFVPYVAHTFADGRREWLFDGYLFLDSDRNPDIRYFPWMDHEGATKADWTWYLDRLFEKGKGLDALNNTIGKVKSEIGDPGFRHKLVLTQLIPTPGNKHWGDVDGRVLDFDKREDMIEACRWYIGELISRYEAAGLDNLDLIGIYWLDEDMTKTRDIAADIAPLVHERGLEYSWIPYFKGRGSDRGWDYGFDMIYLQPGQYWHGELDSRIDNCIDVALHSGFGLEFECESDAISQDPKCKADAMEKYIDAFEKYGVYDKSPIAYYTGSKALLDFYLNPSPENQRIMDRFAGHIVARRSNPKLVVTPKK